MLKYVAIKTVGTTALSVTGKDHHLKSCYHTPEER